jgi:hypothetical protein
VVLPRSSALSSVAEGARAPAGKSLAAGGVAAQATSSTGDSGVKRRISGFMGFSVP